MEDFVVSPREEDAAVMDVGSISEMRGLDLARMWCSVSVPTDFLFFSWTQSAANNGEERDLFKESQKN